MKVCYWDAETQSQQERDMTPEEIAQQVIDAAAAAAPVEAIPMLNLQLVLIDDGHLATVQDIIANMEGDDGLRARAHWEKALTARRDNPLVNLLWPMLYENEAAFNDAWARATAMDP